MPTWQTNTVPGMGNVTLRLLRSMSTSRKVHFLHMSPHHALQRRTKVLGKKVFGFFSQKNKEFLTSVYIFSYNIGVRINGDSNINSGTTEYINCGCKSSCMFIKETFTTSKDFKNH